MTLAARNNILRFGIMVSILLVGLYGATLYYLFFHIESFVEVLRLAFSNTEAISTTSSLGDHATARSFVTLVVIVGAVGVFAVVMVKSLSRYFRKTTAPEVFFFLLCLLLLVPDMLKPLQLVFLDLALPPAYAALLTRALYFSLSFGVLSLFAASLFVVGIEQQRGGMVLAVGFALSVGIAYVLPVDSLELGLSMSHRVGSFRLYQLVLAVIAGLTVLNFVNASLGSGSRDYLVLAGSATALLAGRLWGFWGTGPWEITLAAALVVLGAVVFGVRCYNMYLWK